MYLTLKIIFTDIKTVRQVSLTMLLACSAACQAQFSGVVYDIETRRPVAKAAVHVNPKGTVMTGSDGRFTIDKPFHSVTFSHLSYVCRAMRREELNDTVWLLPKMHTLDEVVVTAKGPNIGFNLKQSVRSAAASSGTKGGIGTFDFFQMFDRRANRHAKNREKLEKILRDY